MTYAVQPLYMDEDEYTPEWVGWHVVYPCGRSIGPLDDREEAFALAAEINLELGGRRPWAAPRVFERQKRPLTAIQRQDREFWSAT